MIRLYVISSDGPGSGKSFLARKLGDEVWSIAGALREELKRKYPEYDWFNKSQEYKDKTVVHEYSRKSVRDVLIDYGQKACQDNPKVWVEKLADRLQSSMTIAAGAHNYCIDDCRKVCEIDYLRAKFGSIVTHIHVETPGVPAEPQYDNEELKRRADYVIKWKRE